MKRFYWTFVLLAGLVLLPSGKAQSTRAELFDLKKSQHELEIMRGILSTTLSFVIKEMRGQEGSGQQYEELIHPYWKFSNIIAFYLPGQGAIFIVPASSLRS